MKHLEKDWYGAVGPLVGHTVVTACGKGVRVDEITRTWSEVECIECEEHLERLADESAHES